MQKTACLLVVWCLSGAAYAAEVGQDGGINLVVSFELDGEDPNSVVPVDSANAEAHYCETFRLFSQDLYRTTEGRHWIRRVRFMEGVQHRDIQWLSKVGGGDSFGTWKKNIQLRERVLDPPVFPADPTNQGSYNPNHSTSLGLARLLNHEFGHFFYRLWDEYVNFLDYKGGKTGVCEGTYSATPPSGVVCEEELPCPGNVDCIFVGECILGTVAPGTPCSVDDSECGPGSLNAGTFCLNDNDCVTGINICVDGKCADGTLKAGDGCANDDECGGFCLKGCGAGGVCLGKGESRDDRVSGQNVRICAHATNLSMPPGNMSDENGVCLMRGFDSAPPYRQWCDGALVGNQQHPDATHVFSLGDNRIYEPPAQRNVTYDLENCTGPPNQSNPPLCETDYVGWSCWDRAKDYQADLVNKHTQIGVYTSVGMPPPLDCQWLPDAVPTGTHAALLVDRSGSMAYEDFSDPPAQAIDLALDGALYFYTQIGLNDWAGVYAFNDQVVAATSDATPLDFGVKASEIDTLDAIAAVGSTDIGLAIQQAHTDIEAEEANGLPVETRNIVLFSDGKDNTPMNDPYVAAQAACDDNIFVNTIAFGDADSAALAQLALCGTSWVTGTETFTVNGVGEPDPLELKTALARMEHYIDGDVEIHETRAPLDPMSISTTDGRLFLVPPGAEALEFSWLANRSCVLDSPAGTTCEPVLNLFEHVELVSPSSVVYPAGLPASAASGVFRHVRVTTPEPGIWLARIDKTEPTPSPTTIPGEWIDKVAATRVSWIGHVEHPDLAGRTWVPYDRAPVHSPVVINASMRFGPLLTGIRVRATVTRAGHSWTVPLLDDGQNGDEASGDGIYGGIFDPDGDWPNVEAGAYRVKVAMQSLDGLAVGVSTDDYDPDGPPPVKRQPLGTAVVEAETSFRLSGSYSVDPLGRPLPGSVAVSCPNLVRGQTVPGLVANVSGIPLLADNTRIALRGADLSIQQLSCPNCGDTAHDPSGSIVFDAAVAADAPTGFHDLSVMSGFDLLRVGGACRVCSLPGDEICNGIDDDCNGLTDEDATGTEDGDLDGIFTLCDNCPFLSNFLQYDLDADGEGNDCDLDDGWMWLRLSSKTRVEWQAEGGSFLWNVYRGDLDVLKSTGVYTQSVGSNALARQDCGLTSTFIDDTQPIAPGQIAYYLVTSTGPAGEEGLGPDGAGVERPNDNACPPVGPT